MKETTPSTPPREIRSQRVAISLTPSDKVELEARAREAGVSPSLLAGLVVRAYLREPGRVLPVMD